MLGLELSDWSNNLKDRSLVEAYYDQLILDLEAEVATGKRGIQMAENNVAMGNLIYRAATQDNLDGVSDGDLALALVAGNLDSQSACSQPFPTLALKSASACNGH